MSKTSRSTPTPVKKASQSSLNTTTPTLKSRWSPRPHDDDPTVKTHDFAYLTGVAPPTFTAKLIASTKTLILSLLSEPFLLHTLALIFGGCCSNVYTLESILTLSSSTGTLITLLQFLAITLYTLPSQLTFTVTSPPEPPPLQPTQTVWFPRVKKRKVPLGQWCIFAAQFVVVNVLNNAAFEYKISLPLHIILRSAGPVASMAVGYVWKGRKYSRRKVFSVGLLFLGVVLAALSDAGAKSPAPTGGSKHKDSMGSGNATTTDQVQSAGEPTSALSQQLPGFILLTLALLLSSVMGIWSDTLYSRHGRSPQIASEQLFYGHLLSLPFFAIQYRTLYYQMNTLMAAAATSAPPLHTETTSNVTSKMDLLSQLNNPSSISPWSRLLSSLTSTIFTTTTTSPLPILLLNSLTQIACISGVHRLSTQTSALTVSIVLNIRKVVSLLLSIWLFGNVLPVGVLVGAGIVFVGGGVYGIPDGKKEDGVEKGRGRKTEVGRRVIEGEKRRVQGESKKDR